MASAYYNHTDRVDPDSHRLTLSVPDPGGRAMWNSVIAAGYAQARPDWGISRRNGDGVLLQFIVRGEGWVRTQNKSFNAQAGDLIFLDCTSPYAMGVKAAKPWAVYHVNFDGLAAPYWVEQFACHSNPIFRPANPGRLRQQFERILRLVSQGLPGYEAQASAIIHAIAADLWVEHAKKNLALPAAIRDRIEKIPPQAREAIERIVRDVFKITSDLNTLDSGLDTFALAKRAGMGRTQMYKIFRKYVGMPPIAYAREYSIQQAQHLLISTNLPLKEIGARIGIDDANYFSRLFHRKVGMGPRQYRQKKSPTA
ncbi:MAG: AraC family transcriptional regulator [Kiritimatiellia bacterium]|jgi:AraC-like DNA-binding protein